MLKNFQTEKTFDYVDVFTFEDAGSQSGLALSNPHSATNITGVDVAAGVMIMVHDHGDDHGPEELEHRPPDGMLVLHSRIFRDSTLQGCH